MDNTIDIESMREALRYNLGHLATRALDDPDIIEIMLNDDGSLWLESFSRGMFRVGSVEPRRARDTISLIASLLGTTVTNENAIIEGELPFDGSRFEGLFPPLVPNPSYTIRKKASKVFSLDRYVEDGIIPLDVREIIGNAIVRRKNILVAGGTGSGKTTLTNALLLELSERCPDDRLVIMEDTNELQCAARNKLTLHSSVLFPMKDLLKATMRLRPDRIIVGEVRGGEALDLLKAWNTGHPGGVCTVHANDAHGGLIRLEQLIAEVSQSPMPALIAEAVDFVLFIEKVEKAGRKVTQVAEVRGLTDHAYKLNHIYRRSCK